MDTTPLTEDEVFAAARAKAAATMPYFSRALYKLIPVKAPGYGTFGVTDKWQLFWDPAKALCWGVLHTATVLLHEMCHPLRRHAQRLETLLLASRLGLNLKSAPGWVFRHWNICADCEINDGLVEAGLEFPPGYCWLPEKLTPPQPRGLLAEEYWDNTFEKAQEQAQEDESREQGEGQPSEGDPSGSGSGASKGKPGEGEQGDDLSDGTCGSGATGVPNRGEKKYIPDDTPGRAPGEVREIIKQVARDVRKFAKKSASGQYAGSVPGGMQRWANTVLAPPKVSWQQRLRRTLSSGIDPCRGRQDYTRSRISRKQHAYGWDIDAVMAPAMQAYKPRIRIGLDTSASMSDSDVAKALAEVQGILRAVSATVDFCACDAAVQATAKVRTVTELTKHIVGGGGTDFRPLLASADKARPRPDILIVFTDGCGPAPEKAPNGIQVIWVLIGDYKRKPSSNGSSISYGSFIEVD